MSDRDVDHVLIERPKLVVRRADGTSYLIDGSPGWRTADVIRHARTEYVAGRIELDEFERRIEAALDAQD